MGLCPFVLVKWLCVRVSVCLLHAHLPRGKSVFIFKKPKTFLKRKEAISKITLVFMLNTSCRAESPLLGLLAQAFNCLFLDFCVVPDMECVCFSVGGGWEGMNYRWVHVSAEWYTRTGSTWRTGSSALHLPSLPLLLCSLPIHETQMGSFQNFWIV